MAKSLTFGHLAGLCLFAFLAAACGLLLTATGDWVRGTVLDSFGLVTAFGGVIVLVSLADRLWEHLATGHKK